MKYSLFFLISLLISNLTLAETMFLNDKLVVPLRAGEGLQFRIVHKGVKSGTKLEILEQNRATGYSKVRTPDGIEGYLPTRYLTRTPIARDQLAKVTKERDAAISKLAEMKSRFQDLETNYNALKQSEEKLSKNFNEQSKAYAELQTISANAVTLDKRNKELRLENEKLKNSIELLTAENYRLKDNSRTNNWMIGGGLVVLGMFLAVIIPLFKPEKKNDGWS